MARPLQYSDEEDSPAKPPPPKSRRSGDDLSGNTVLPNRTRTSRAPSGKQDINNKENLRVMEDKMAKIAQSIERTKRLVNAEEKAAALAPPPVDDDGFESEERDAQSGGEDLINFHSSITSLPPLPVAAPRATPVFLKLKKSAGPPRTSSRAFLTLPEVGPTPASDPELDHAASPDHEIDPDDMDLDVANHSASSSPSTTRSSRQSVTPAPLKRGRQSSPPPPPPPKRTRREPKFADGYVAASSGKPKAADYEPVVRALLIRAMSEYTVNIVTKNAFPPLDLQLRWAKESFRSACRAADLHFTITDRMIKLITKRGSHVRSQIVTACRALFAPHYKFNRTSTSTSAIKFNRDLSTDLCYNARFHYKDVDAATGFAENSIFNHIRQAVIFKNKTSLGAVFTSRFNPYPEPATALEFTAVHFCAKEYSTGQFIRADFLEKDVIDDYNTHLADIRGWAEMDEAVVLNIRKKWYNRGVYVVLFLQQS
ncbi:hypothetical protein C8R46DRAFT_1310955 [Mycena filopes]|nr:hypothetical protein C8R46DRAFT_1310955 [Mycena filopes]